MAKLPNCEACSLPVNNVAPRTLTSKQHLINCAGIDLGRVFPSDLIEGALEGDIHLCKPCATLFIGLFSGPEACDEDDDEEEENETDDDAADYREADWKCGCLHGVEEHKHGKCLVSIGEQNCHCKQVKFCNQCYNGKRTDIRPNKCKYCGRNC